MTGRAAIELGGGLLVIWALSFVAMFLLLGLVVEDIGHNE